MGKLREIVCSKFEAFLMELELILLSTVALALSTLMVRNYQYSCMMHARSDMEKFLGSTQVMVADENVLNERN